MIVSAKQQKMHRAGYLKGRRDGFEQGKQAGFAQGIQDAQTIHQTQFTVETTETIKPHHTKEIALSYQPSQKKITEQLIRDTWERLHLDQTFTNLFQKPAQLSHHPIKPLKNTHKSSIWKLQLQIEEQNQPIILKIIKAQESDREANVIELNMYLKADEVLFEVMPTIYHAEPVEGNAWIFMEFVHPIEGQIQFTPKYFDKIIPSLAILHARTHNERFYVREDLFLPWMPMYNSRPVYTERREHMGRTLKLYQTAMKKTGDKELASFYPIIERSLSKGPNLFAELIDAGQSIAHCDLQMNNIACNHISETSPWPVKFLDWEGAKFIPCWIDLANLVGVFFSYRDDWRAEEEQMISHCAHLYAQEMSKHGITFREDPVRLYKMGNLQRIFDGALHHQLHWFINKTYRSALLKGSLQKIQTWGNELGLV